MVLHEDSSKGEVFGEGYRGRLVQEICRRLLKRDPDIVEIVQFGSSIYAPDLSRDVDLLVISKSPKDYNVYLDAVDEVNPPFDVDIVVVRPGQDIREELIRGILGAFEVLYGDGGYVLSYAGKLGDPTFEEARSALRVARSILGLALEARDPLDRDRLVREAFDSLFHAARIAAMTHLSTEVARWGLLRRMLPEPHNERFRESIDVLHIKYFYSGEYPKENIVEEFNKWFKKVEEFINDLEYEARKKQQHNSRH